jgi:hypothetical protein
MIYRFGDGGRKGGDCPLPSVEDRLSPREEHRGSPSREHPAVGAAGQAWSKPRTLSTSDQIVGYVHLWWTRIHPTYVLEDGYWRQCPPVVDQVSPGLLADNS